MFQYWFILTFCLKIMIKYTLIIQKNQMRLDMFMQEIRTYDFVTKSTLIYSILRNAIKKCIVIINH